MPASDRGSGREATPTRRNTSMTCVPTSRRALTTAWSSVVAPSPWRVTSARPRGCRSPRSPSVWAARQRRSRPTSTTRLRLTKDLRIAHALTPASARRATRAAFGAFPDHEVARGSKHGRTHAAMAWRHGPTPDPGRRSTVRRGATCARTSRGTPGAAPVWHAEAGSATCRLVSTEAPDARASLALGARASRATAGGVGSAHSAVGF